jgi:hypothetical protein
MAAPDGGGGGGGGSSETGAGIPAYRVLTGSRTSCKDTRYLAGLHFRCTDTPDLLFPSALRREDDWANRVVFFLDLDGGSGEDPSRCYKVLDLSISQAMRLLHRCRPNELSTVHRLDPERTMTSESGGGGGISLWKRAGLAGWRDRARPADGEPESLALISARAPSTSIPRVTHACVMVLNVLWEDGGGSGEGPAARLVGSFHVTVESDERTEWETHFDLDLSAYAFS